MCIRDRNTVEDMLTILGQLDPELPFPERALRAGRAKGSKVQRVRLPDGFLDDPEDDTPPRGPHSLAEIEAWERSLSGG